MVNINNNFDMGNGKFTVEAQPETLNRNLDVSGATVLDNTLNLKDDFDINSGKFTVEAGTGNNFTRNP